MGTFKAARLYEARLLEIVDQKRVDEAVLRYCLYHVGALVAQDTDHTRHVDLLK